MCLGSIHTYIYVARRTLYVSRQYIYMCPGSTYIYVARRTDPLHMCLGSTYIYVARRTLYAEIKSPVRDDV